ncbi:MAG: DNA alkylation repair protein [Phycisphaerales bacterium]|nr:DNA alkylation repair protein [Phycisphaerales bacterium]
MKAKEILAHLESLGDETRRRHNAKIGPDGTAPASNFYGVKMGDIRALAKKIKSDHALALELWATGNVEAQLLATLLISPAALSAPDLASLTRTTSCAQVAEWMNSYVVAQHPEELAFREAWMNDASPWLARAGWHITAGLVNKGGLGEIDPAALLERIARDLPMARPEVQWTMNNTLGAIGIEHPALRTRAIAIGESVGLYRNWPVSKGCTPPYVPVWVNEMVKRKQG